MKDLFDVINKTLFIGVTQFKLKLLIQQVTKQLLKIIFFNFSNTKIYRLNGERFTFIADYFLNVQFELQ